MGKEDRLMIAGVMVIIAPWTTTKRDCHKDFFLFCIVTPKVGSIWQKSNASLSLQTTAISTKYMLKASRSWLLFEFLT